jgi:hypothetical protein
MTEEKVRKTNETTERTGKRKCKRITEEDRGSKREE